MFIHCRAHEYPCISTVNTKHSQNTHVRYCVSGPPDARRISTRFFERAAPCTATPPDSTGWIRVHVNINVCRLKGETGVRRLLCVDQRYPAHTHTHTQAWKPAISHRHGAFLFFTASCCSTAVHTSLEFLPPFSFFFFFPSAGLVIIPEGFGIIDSRPRL